MRRALPPLTVPVLAGLLLAGCAGAASLPFPPVPARLAETLPKPPVSGQQLRWHPGDWEWVGNAYAWQPGQWEPTGPGTQWLPGHWDQTPGGYAWLPGRWV